MDCFSHISINDGFKQDDCYISVVGAGGKSRDVLMSIWPAKWNCVQIVSDPNKLLDPHTMSSSSADQPDLSRRKITMTSSSYAAKRQA